MRRMDSSFSLMLFKYCSIWWCEVRICSWRLMTLKLKSNHSNDWNLPVLQLVQQLFHVFVFVVALQRSVSRVQKWRHVWLILVWHDFNIHVFFLNDVRRIFVETTVIRNRFVNLGNLHQSVSQKLAIQKTSYPPFTDCFPDLFAFPTLCLLLITLVVNNIAEFIQILFLLRRSKRVKEIWGLWTIEEKARRTPFLGYTLYSTL